MVYHRKGSGNLRINWPNDCYFRTLCSTNNTANSSVSNSGNDILSKMRRVRMGIPRHAFPVKPRLVSISLTQFRFITLYLLAFYVIFECVLNVFAEVTRFADRGFYDAWWNSTTWDQVPLSKFVFFSVLNYSSSQENGINQYTYFFFVMFIIPQSQPSVFQKQTPRS
jgi:hypothetical protein